MTEESTTAHPARLPQVLGRLGLYATYVTAAMVLLVIAGDLAVLVRRPPIVGLLALLVVVGPLVAMMLSTFASYVNYYGTWRIVRGQDEYDAGQDLKSHAADIPQALQRLLAGRRGCLPAVSTALLFISLLLAGAANVPPSTPAIGALGTWHDHIGGAVLVAPTATPTAVSTASATATATALPTATATAQPTVTPRPRPVVIPTATTTATATPTPPPIINFKVVPPTASSTSCQNGIGPSAQPVTLDNSQSTVDVSWQATAVETILNAPWATITDANGTTVTQGTVPAGKMQTITVNPYPPLPAEVCRNSTPNGTLWHMTFVTTNAGSPQFIYTVFA